MAEEKGKAFDPNGWEKEHAKGIRKTAGKVEALMREAEREAVRIAESVGTDTPAGRKRMAALAKRLAAEIEVTVENGNGDEWERSNAKNDALIASIAAMSALNAEQIERYRQRNLEALKAFNTRKTGGLGLSDRVWNLTEQFRQELELALETGIGDGRSAAELSRDMREYLNDPHKLFRRVRSRKDGALRLSRAAAAYHPGRGRYRSSYKNALRMAATEGNMAYRSADWERWGQMDSVVGIEVRLSNNHTVKDAKGKAVPLRDICDELAGKYPKDFKFTGWHPLCRCHAVPILKTKEELAEDVKRIIAGKDPLPPSGSKNYVKKPHEGFSSWAKDNADRIEVARGRGKLPYFVRDNNKYFGGKTIAERAAIRHNARTAEKEQELREYWENKKRNNVSVPKFEAKTTQEMRDYILENIADSCTLEIKAKDMDLWNDIVNQLNSRIRQFRVGKFGNIGVPRSRKAEASWDEFGNNLNLNVTALRNKTAIKHALAWKKKGVLYSFAWEDENDYVRAIIDHELGHLILSRYANIGDVAMLMGKVGKSIVVNGKPFNPINDVLGYYASTEEHEFFAEAFSFYMGKNRDMLDGRIKDYFEKLYSRNGFKLDGNTKPKIEQDAPHFATEPTHTPLTKEQRIYTKTLEIEAIKMFSGRIVNNVFEIKIGTRGIKEFINQPFAEYQQKNEMARKLPDIIQNAEYIGEYDAHNKKNNPHLLSSLYYETEMNGKKVFLIMRKYDNGDINFHSISATPPNKMKP